MVDDQAAALRRTVPPLPSLPGYAVTGGKGGIGKTCIAVNLALCLAQLGQRPLLVDLDLGLANADLVLGVDPALNLADAVLAGREVASVVCESAHGVGLVPAASGVQAMAQLSPAQLQRLFAGLALLARQRQPLILDTAAGIGTAVLAACRAARTVLVVLTPEPTALADAYALIKVLEQSEPGRDLRVIVNLARDLQDGLGAYARLKAVAERHLGRSLELLGVVPRDELVPAAVRRRRPLAPGPALEALRGIAAKLATLPRPAP
ncbi:MAG: AAA family ATPase [Planctomycetota bacterium]|nr:AAA family ATPase [Planctomycetota bacterium]MCX8039469.1 AAA family ATPase [Planctomycetota bacterium]MDW8373587.1 AAA family ATPase [Planctomycetota bacterium]